MISLLVSVSLFLCSFTESEIEIKSETVSLLWPWSQDEHKAVVQSGGWVLLTLCIDQDEHKAIVQLWEVGVVNPV